MELDSLLLSRSIVVSCIQSKLFYSWLSLCYNSQMDYSTEIEFIVGKELLDSWITLKPTVYYKDSKPFGLIALVNDYYIVSTVSEPTLNFTIAMIKEIKRLYNTQAICLITDDDEYQDLIARSLSRYEFEFETIDKVLYSRSKLWE